MPSMLEAAKIRDVAARHAYVFDNGLCSPDFFDVEKRMASEEFGLLFERIEPTQSVLEIGCFTGLNLLGLKWCGHAGKLKGIDFVQGALEWLLQQESTISVTCRDFPGDFQSCYSVGDFDAPGVKSDVAICFDVLEHQQNVGYFLDGVAAYSDRSLFLVPVDKHYFDCGHVAFFPDAECLRNVLDYVFEVEELFELKTCRKLFASCRRRA